MSGKDLVQQMRSGGAPPPRPPSSGIGGFLLTVICTFVIGGAAAFGLFVYLPSQTRTANAVEIADNSPFTGVDLTAREWTAEDQAHCEQVALQAAEAEAASIDGEMMEGLIMPSSSGGLAERGAMMMCMMTTKVARFCDPEPRLQLAKMIDEYTLKLDAVSALFRTSVASLNNPMLMIATGGREMPGTEIVGDGLNRTFERMKAVHIEITKTFRDLVRAGLIGPEDFDVFLGYGVRPAVEAMIGDARVTQSICI